MEDASCGRFCTRFPDQETKLMDEDSVPASERTDSNPHRDSGETTRRRWIAGLTAGAITATAGCSEFAEEFFGSGALGGGEAAHGTVYGTTETFEFDAEAGEEINITIQIGNEGTGSGEITLSGPGGTLISARNISLSSDTRTSATAEEGGTHELTVDPQNAQLSVSVNVS